MDLTILLNILFSLAGIYLLLGLVFSLILLIRGFHKLDQNTHGTGIGFKMIVIPGLLVFWPFLLKKLMKRKS